VRSLPTHLTLTAESHTTPSRWPAYKDISLGWSDRPDKKELGSGWVDHHISAPGNCRPRLHILSDPPPRLPRHTLTMYGYTKSNEPPSTPPRSSRSSTFTAQTPTRSQPGSALLPPTPTTARSTTTVTTATSTGFGDTAGGNPSLITYTTISQEYASLRYPGHCPLGMYLIPDKNNMFVWDGVFFVHQGSSPLL